MVIHIPIPALAPHSLPVMKMMPWTNNASALARKWRLDRVHRLVLLVVLTPAKK